MQRLTIRAALAASALLLASLAAAPGPAQPAADAPGRSRPQPGPLPPAIPAPVDAPYPGVMTLEVDATDITRAIWKVRQVIPVSPQAAAAGRLTLLYPEWLPGKHGPRGALASLAGLAITAGGERLAWRRDPVEVYAFHVPVPQGARELVAEFQFLSPLRATEGRVAVTPAMMNVQWEQVALYPAGHFTRAIRIRPSIRLPEGWTGVAAMDGQRSEGGVVRWDETDFETFVDSPLFAGPHYRRWDLGSDVLLHVWADEARFLAAEDAHIAAHRRLVEETLALFGSRPFDRYHFLLGLTEELGGIGLEHHRSSENTRETDYFTEWDGNGSERGLLPHEFVHSWNGKHRRPARLWTPTYAEPMQDDLLWVYEGQTSFWDLVLAARSRMQSKEMVLAEWARFAASYAAQPGREWRSVEDTTFDPVFAARRPKPHTSWSRTEDYYNEGSLVWLEADQIIREKTRGARSMDDFARAFFGGREGDWGQVTYERSDLVATLQAIVPHDWDAFFDSRISSSGQPAPLGGIEKGGYRLVFRDTPNVYDAERFKESGAIDMAFSLGFLADKAGVVTDVTWDGPAWRAGLVVGARLVAVNGVAATGDRLKRAVTEARGGREPVRLLAQRGDRYLDLEVPWSEGLRYPHLEKVQRGETGLDRLLMPRVQRR